MAFVNLGQITYPIGAVYMSKSATSPSTLFGGTWAEITGAVLRANKQAGVYSDSDTHTLTIDEMPKHAHGLHVDTWASSFGGWGVATTNGAADYWSEDTSKGEPIGFKGGGKRILPSKEPTMSMLGCVQPKLYRGDATCVTSQMYKLKLKQLLKKYALSQLDSFTNHLVQQAQQVYMVVHGPLYQMVNFYVQRELGIKLAEKIHIRLPLQKCQVIITNWMLFIWQILQEARKLVTLQDGKNILLMYLRQQLRSVGIQLTTMFPHTELATVGIVQLNMCGDESC